LQLVRQLTAMALNCQVSGLGADCSGNANLSGVFSSCDDICIANSSKSGINGCIGKVDCFNNGGAIDAQGVCNPNAPNGCIEDLPPPFDRPGADTSDECNQAHDTDCKIVPPQETLCTQPGLELPGIEACP
jgi:hypothetical protein